MSIASQISRLMNAKSAIRTAIQNKGVTVPASTKLDDYADLIASIPAGSSAWTKVAETTITANVTSTSNTTLLSWDTGASQIWTSDKFVFVRVRDTAGKRAGYFYGSDNWFSNFTPVNQSSGTSWNSVLGFRYRVTSADVYASTTSTYGIWPSSITNTGKVSILGRYNANNSLTINGTFKIEVYLLDPADGTPIYQ